MMIRDIVDWRYRHTVLVLVTLAFFVTMAGRLVVSPVAPQITAQFDISNTELGLALTGMWLAYSLSQFPSGILGDRFGERSVILVSVSGTALSLLLLAVSPSFALFAVLTFVLGIAAGLHYTTATTFLSRSFDNMGFAIGVHSVGGPIAGLLTPVLASLIAVHWGWRVAVAHVVVVAIPIIVLFVVSVRTVTPRHPERSLTDNLSGEDVAGLLFRPPIVFTVVVAILGNFAWQATASFLPTFLVEYRGYSSSLAGIVFSLYFLFYGLVQVGVGRLSDWSGHDLTLSVCMLTGGLGYTLLVAGPGFGSVVVASLLIGIGMSYNAALIPRFLKKFDESRKGTQLGLVRTVYGIGGAMGSVVTGTVADTFGWAIAFLFLVALLSVVLVLLVANSVAGRPY